MKIQAAALPLALASVAAFSFAPRAEACGGGLVSSEGSLVTQQSQLALMSLRAPVGDGVATTDIAVLLTVPSANEDFGVLIPLPADRQPVIDEDAIDGAAFTGLEEGTRPIFFGESSGGGGGDAGLFGCGGVALAGKGGDESANVVAGPAVDVGPVTAQYLLAEDAAALTAYLDDNGFVLPAGGLAIVESYIAQGNGFLAFKRSDADASADPVSVGVHFSVPGDLRSVAFRMVSLGAPDVLPMTLFVAGPEAVGADAPWTTVHVDDLDDELAIDDYAGLVDSLTAENDGKLFVFEGSIDKAQLGASALTALLDDGAVVSRLSARIPGSALDADAAFNVDAPAAAGAAAAAAFRLPKNVDVAAVALFALTLVVRRRRR